MSPPDIAPHSAGAAVDLTLADADGRELDLGTRMNADPEESEGACYTEAADISTEARANRKLLGSVLTAAGARGLSHRVVALVLRRSVLGSAHRWDRGPLRPEGDGLAGLTAPGRAARSGLRPGRSHGSHPRVWASGERTVGRGGRPFRAGDRTVTRLVQGETRLPGHTSRIARRRTHQGDEG